MVTKVSVGCNKLSKVVIFLFWNISLHCLVADEADDSLLYILFNYE